ncbi:MAG: hypothetical protein GY750_04690 [Lentisphaerae bacterium]|nr:hypothetical protein [Lentisphaerota bacterium]MCP4100709.1 hypothetical protein [Lentisphaerota bacterium]
MIAIYKDIHDAYNYIYRITQSQRKKLWTILFFERGAIHKVVSDYYVFTSAPYVGNVMHKVAAKALEFQGVNYHDNPEQVRHMTRALSDKLQGDFFAAGGDERGGHAEDFLLKCMYFVYAEVMGNRPDTAVLLNSDSPCTLFDSRPSKAVTVTHPKHPDRKLVFNDSCTAKVDQLAAEMRDVIPHWILYYRKKWGVCCARRGSADVLAARDQALAQMNSLRNISVHPFTAAMEDQCKASKL